jgi:hypothetical protein
VEETQEVPAQKQDKEQPGRQTESFRQSRRQCHLVGAVDGMEVEGPPSRLVWSVLKSVVHERFQRWRQMGVFEKLM